MQQYPLSNSQIILEITETSIPENINIANETINRIALRGHKISIDDFGTGHSSLEKLRDIMVDEIKIDKSSLKMISQQDTKRIVKIIISLANELNINIVAEGVETQDQLDEISEMGVPSIKLNWRGEPLLHPKLCDFISYAKNKSIIDVSINTNATTLTKKKI